MGERMKRLIALCVALFVSVSATQAQQVSGGSNVQQTSTVLLASQVVNFNSANTDNIFPVVLPPGFTRYFLSTVRIFAASGTLTTSTAAVYTGAAASNENPVVNVSPTVSTASDATNNNAQSMTVVNASTQSYTLAARPNLYFRIGTAQGTAATATVLIAVIPLP